MEKKLRTKFIVFSSGAVLIVLIIIAGFINISSYSRVNSRANELLAILAENDGYFPKPSVQKEGYDLPPKFSQETPFSTRFFTVKVEKNGNIASVDTGKIYSISTDQALEYADTALQKNRTSGFMGDYKYLITEKNYGTLVVFVDCGMDLQLFRSFFANSILICVVGMLAVFILVTAFSKKVVAPIVESYEKQKRFITDASHELKTPLAIIGASTEVMELDNGESQWTASIQNQVERLSELVNMLVSLTRLDEEKSELKKTEFSLSDAVLEAAQPFEAVGGSCNRELHLQVEKNISYCGNEDAIRQLVAILLDNAMKYASSDSAIILSLKRQGKRCVLQTSNLADDIEQGSYDMLFERFYRRDSARNSKAGSYGIGLSIAKAIVQKHKGKISAESPDGKIMLLTAQF